MHITDGLYSYIRQSVPRPAKPKPPPSAETQRALDTLRPLIEQERAAGDRIVRDAAGYLLEAMSRVEAVLRSRPDHPGHEVWKEMQERTRSPENWHRR